MFVYLKQGLALKKKDSLLNDPVAQGPFLLCPRPDHQDNALNIVCLSAVCPKRGLLCSVCFFQDHASHSTSCCSLKDFLKKYRDFLQKAKETSQKELKEEDSETLRQSFEAIQRMMLTTKQRFEEQCARLEASLKQKELFLANALQNKNLTDLMDLVNNMSQGSINTINGYTEAMNYILEGLGGSPSEAFRDEKLKLDLMPNSAILEKSLTLRTGIEIEFQSFDSLFNKTAVRCQNLLLEKEIPRIGSASRNILASEFEGFLSEVVKRNVRIGSFVRIYKSSEDGIQRGGIGKRIEEKQGVLVLIQGTSLTVGVFYEGMGVNSRYAVFSLQEKRKIKESRIWGLCSCKNRDSIVFTSSNLHEVMLLDEPDKRDDNYIEDGPETRYFTVKEIEIYELLI